MHKAVLFFIFFFICFKISAQSELYVLSVRPQNITGPDGAGECDGRIGDYRNGYSVTHSTGRYQINSNSVYIKIDYQEGYNDDPGYGCNGPCGQYSEMCNGVEYESTFNHFSSYENIYSGEDPITCGTQDCLAISYKAVFLPSISAPVGKLCEKEQLFAQYSDGVNHNVNDLVWEFYSNTGWKEIPNHKNRYPLNVSLLDVFGASWRTQFTGNLQLRFKYTAPFTSDVLYSFSTYTISLTECSPEFDSLSAFKTKCNYSEDGSFKLKVKRDLDSNEKLIMTLYYQYSTGFDLAPNPQETSSNLFNEPDGSYSHTWSENLPSGNYKIKYQTKIGSGGISPTDPTWTTLSEYSFTITNARRVEFSAEKLNDESCFEVEDGKIRVYNVISESNRSFSYIVYEVQGTNTVTVLKNWTSFASNNVIINNLKKTRLRLKLKDSQGCFAKLN
ncbi:hypothetical protein SAMN04489761_1210 [Tenacibaculum sp. MAR_2009_124]|uniref:hypothetical protein n=1 Tax=Tenacibaculum sp. MAR_2009_124 TaxID=1250059 RepID=UPI00089B2EDB|nr:hypothetical protein [Tenacibaculum sp. MAR_2009_124]SEB52452.1 hypothetical protein SAMN04489761_1210 [Tenacibaculum sp. MAR_2009_124]